VLVERIVLYRHTLAITTAMRYRDEVFMVRAQREFMGDSYDFLRR
jgi:hypothetical protein